MSRADPLLASTDTPIRITKKAAVNLHSLTNGYLGGQCPQSEKFNNLTEIVSKD
jgi:hypothetical protein